jgi:26S proteasome regulatory subunit N2
MAHATSAGQSQDGSAAQRLLALLEEDEPILQEHALQQLYKIIDHHWAEVSNKVTLIESLSEEPSFAHRELAAAVASRCFFHLEEYGDALRLALGAGPHFDVSASSLTRSPVENLYVDTMVSKCIDKYVESRSEGNEEELIDPRMISIIERMFERCYNDSAWTQAMGVSLESRRLDQVRECFSRAPMEGGDKAALLNYTLDLCVGQQQLLHSRVFREQVLRILVDVHSSMADEDRDYAAEIQCLQHLDNAPAATEVLKTLLRGPEPAALLAYQLGFDIAESDHQPFILAVLSNLGTTNEDSNETDEYMERLGKLQRVLKASGFMVDLQLNFVHGQSKADPLLLLGVKDALEPKNMTLHQATVAAHGFMFAGTANTAFVREHMDWFKKSSNWAKFSATASIGVIHRPKGTLAQSKAELQAYLPQPTGSTSPYSEGGALYALGLIHAAKAGEVPTEGAAGETVVSYLLETLDNAGPNEPIQHGGCLAVGLAAMGTAQEPIFEKLRDILFADSAVAGEGAAYGIGFLLLGQSRSNDWTAEALTTLLSHMHETKHEKIIRALGMSMALASYGREEEAETLIETTCRDRDAIIRYGAMYTVGLAYVGTGANSAVKRLLHIAVSDVSDDVRRAAVTNLGFVLFRQPERLPPLVSLLAESYNPHVRYGSALALGIALAGQANSDAGKLALDLLDNMHSDVVDFVRQGSLIATAMILMQQPDVHPSMKSFREKLSTIVREKHQSTLTKVGGIMAHGILDAGGRNVTLSLSSRAGFTKATSVVGIALWAQHWYWYPLQHMLGLAFSPTPLIGLNKNFDMPTSFAVTCASKPSLFAYPKMTEVKKEEKKELVATALLSTTARAKAREARKDKNTEEKEKEEPAEKDKENVKENDKVDSESKMTDDAPATEKVTKKKKVAEPSQFSLSNPSRVTPEQEQYVSFDMQQRYVPINPRSKPAGIVILVDRTPEEAEEVVQVDLPSLDSEKDEASPPEPFEWSPDSN